MATNQTKGTFYTTKKRDLEFYDNLPPEFRDYLKYNWTNSSAENLQRVINKLSPREVRQKLKQKTVIRKFQYKQRIENGVPWV